MTDLVSGFGLSIAIMSGRTISSTTERTMAEHSGR